MEERRNRNDDGHDNCHDVEYVVAVSTQVTVESSIKIRGS